MSWSLKYNSLSNTPEIANFSAQFAIYNWKRKLSVLLSLSSFPLLIVTANRLSSQLLVCVSRARGNSVSLVDDVHCPLSGPMFLAKSMPFLFFLQLLTTHAQSYFYFCFTYTTLPPLTLKETHRFVVLWWRCVNDQRPVHLFCVCVFVD